MMQALHCVAGGPSERSKVWRDRRAVHCSTRHWQSATRVEEWDDPPFDAIRVRARGVAVRVRQSTNEEHRLTHRPLRQGGAGAT